MTIMLHTPLLPKRQASKRDIVVVNAPDPLVDVGEFDIAVYATALATLQRQLEIVNGWEWLWNGIRDRNIMNAASLPATPWGDYLYSGAPLNSLVEANRLTYHNTTLFTDGMIYIGIGIRIVQLEEGATQWMDSGFRMLREAALGAIDKANT